LFEIVDQMVWHGAIWIARGDRVSNLKAEFTGGPRALCPDIAFSS
jgi:hypothetical protein